MTDLLELKPDDVVLEIGTGLGFSRVLMVHAARFRPIGHGRRWRMTPISIESSAGVSITNWDACDAAAIAVRHDAFCAIDEYDKASSDPFDEQVGDSRKRKKRKHTSSRRATA